MADAELKVLITGDASDLERTINKVNGELSKLQSSQGKANAATKEGEAAAEGAAQANKELANSIDDVSSSQEKNTNTTKKNTDEVEKNSKSHKRSVEQWEKSGRAAQNLGSGLNKATRPLQTASLLLAAGGVASAKFAIDFEDSFSGVEKTVDGTVEQLAKIKQGIIDMTTVGINGHSAIPQTTTELNELAAAGGQLGIHTENILDFTEVMAQMGVATNLVGEQGASTLARLMNVMNVGQDQIRNIGSSIVDLGNNSATTEAEIAEMALRMGKFGNTVGMSLPDVLGYSAALSSLGIEAQAGGSAIGRTWLAIETAVAAGGAELANFAKYSGKSAQEFRDQWNTDAKGAFNGLLKGLKASENLTLALGELGINNTLDIQAMQALANGFDLVESSVERANRAYTENTALQTEFDKKAATTASQLKIMKNNFVEFGRSMGETMLPGLVDMSGGLMNFAKGLNSASDETKGALVKVGLGVVGVGAATKVTASGLETVGNAMEGIATIKKVASGTGKLATFAKGLVSVGSVAKPAALGIAAVGAAVWAGKKAYDAWYDSQYNWTEGLEDRDADIKEHLSNVNELSDIQKQIKDLRLVIENPSSSQEAVEQARAKVKELAGLLEKEYKIKISEDGSDGEEKIGQRTEREINGARADIFAQMKEFEGKKDKYDQAKYAYAFNSVDAEKAKINVDNYTEALAELRVQEQKTGKESEEYTQKVEDIVNKYPELASAAVSDLDSGLEDRIDIEEKNFKSYEERAEKQKEIIDNYIGSHESLANKSAEVLEYGVETGDLELQEESLNNMAQIIKRAGLDASGYAEDAAQKLNGISWSDAFQKGGETLDNMVGDYIDCAERFGVAAEDTALNAGLLKNGFKSIEEAADAGKLKEVTSAANEYAKTIEGMENKKIEISAEGDMSVINEITGKVEELKTSEGVTVKINADGDVSVLDQAGNELRYLDTNEAVNLQVNAEGNIDVLNEAGDVVETIPQDVQTNVDATTNYKKGEQEPPSNENATVNYEKGWQNSPSDENAKVNYKLGGQDEPEDKTATVTYRAKYVNNAKGTSDFQGGLAMINDQKGISDPTELVEINGKGYTFEGKDVILPLPKHAKVYTADETKQILSGKIPHFAKGTDPWDNAKKEWSYQQNSVIVPLTAQDSFNWIERMRNQFSGNVEAMKELDEEFVKATKQSWKEALDALEYGFNMGELSAAEHLEALKKYVTENITEGTAEYKDAMLNIRDMEKSFAEDSLENSKNWLMLRAEMNDWDDFNDSMNDAFYRYTQALKDSLDKGYITEDEYYQKSRALGDDLYEARFQNSTEWIEREKEVNGLSYANEKAAIDRIAKYTEDSYRDGIISHEEYVRAKMDISDMYYEHEKKKLEGWIEDADWYQRQAETYGWDFLYKDSEEEYWKRRYKKELAAAGNMDLTAEERKAATRRADEALLKLYEARNAAVKDVLDTMEDAISEIEDSLDNQISTIQDIWAADDREEDIEETRRLLDLYKNSATEEGREKYKALQEELKQLEREQFIEELEAGANLYVESLRDELKGFEGDLEGLDVDDILHSDAINNLIADIKSSSSDVEEVLSALTVELKKLNEGDYGSSNTTQNFYNTINDKTDAEALILKAVRIAMQSNKYR